jgi:hypothetical protein
VESPAKRKKLNVKKNAEKRGAYPKSAARCVSPFFFLQMPSQAQYGANFHQLPVVIAPARS